MRNVTVAVIQCPLGDDRDTNVARVLDHLHAAADAGASLVLPPELFEGPYFCAVQDAAYAGWARPFDGHPTITAVAEVARTRGIVVPVSYFERAGQAAYNSLAMVDADGTVLGNYRKSHIPDGPGYQEKYYFRPGDTGFRVWDTRVGRVGVGICWDQWFPEAARAMALMGAELLCYPTAIGSEPALPDEDTADPWRRVMVGHAVANSMPVLAANRVGTEQVGADPVVFYGTSFVADPRGDVVAEVARDAEGIATATFDLDALAERRDAWGFFRDRRPELYRALLGADGAVG